MFCPAGYGRVARAAPPRRPPTRLRVRPSWPDRRAEPRRSSPPLRSGSAGVSTRRSGRSGPARSGAIGLRPLGGLGHPPPRLTARAPSSCGGGAIARAPQPPATTLGLQQDLRLVGGGYSIRPSGEAAMAPEAAGPQRAHRRRETLAPTEGFSEGGEQRGTRRRGALLGRGRRSFGPQRAGASKARTPLRPRGKARAVPAAEGEQP